uniref:Ig-like domain-containing protein n=1 Tax=Hippocampus comes TaxID=109280 RepID=A0A3Q2YWM0_HIPCM
AGETVTFATTVTPPATPFLVVTWSVTDVHGTLKNIITSTSVNETMQEYRDRITLFRHTGSLELRNVSLRDAGDFTVTVIPAGGAQQRGNCKLDVHGMLHSYTDWPFLHTLQLEVKTNATEMFEFSGPVHLSCSSTGTSPSFRWLNGSSEVTESERVQITGGGSKLTVLNVTRYDLGPFRCHVFNLISNGTSGPVVLSVHCESQINFLPCKFDRIYARNLNPRQVVLSCSSAGSFPTFVWRNGSAELAAGDGVHIDGKGAVVTILNVSRYDEGPYTCHVFNNFSNATSRPLKLSISYGPESIHLKQFPPGEYFARGSNISLSCSAACRPSARFEWFLNGESLSRTGPNLNLVNVLENQSGNYSCRAVNIKTAKSQMTKPSAIFIQCKSGFIK